MWLLPLQVLRHERHLSHHVEEDVETPKDTKRTRKKFTLRNAIKEIEEKI